ncbi:uncharacterized protein LOC135366922 [Ornithodoros turicata]|uniref:uncharacterized protein LOC135366922 n=1 Tax=Ornithodoros turicata TaxID=34597 RepID=UPI0031392198
MEGQGQRSLFVPEAPTKGVSARMDATACDCSPPFFEDCVPAIGVDASADWLEQDVIAGFRVWQLMFLSLAGIIVVVVVLCCIMKCRIPRTKQEIEADFHRKKLTQVFRKQLNKIPADDLTFNAALDNVKTQYDREEEKRNRGSWDSLAECEDLTLRQKLRKFMRSLMPKPSPQQQSGAEDAASGEALDSNADDSGGRTDHSGATNPESDDSVHSRTAKDECITIEEDNKT